MSYEKACQVMKMNKGKIHFFLKCLTNNTGSPVDHQTTGDLHERFLQIKFYFIYSFDECISLILKIFQNYPFF